MNIKFNAANAAMGSGKCQNVDNHAYAFIDGEIPLVTERYIRGCVYKAKARYALNEADAEDLEQEIYHAVYKRIREFDEARNAALTTFLHLCVDGAVREYVRSMKRLKNAKLVFILDAPVSGSRNDTENDASTLIDCLPAEGSELGVKRTDLKNGIHLKDVLEWVKSGRLEKRGRGVYRIAHYLPTEYDTYAEAVALVGDTAMICGESVLAMHNLALVNPVRVHVAVRRRLRKELPDWIETEKATSEITEDNFNGIPCQKLSEVIRLSRGKILTERLVSAVHEAGTKGLLDVFEYEALKKEFSV